MKDLQYTTEKIKDRSKKAIEISTDNLNTTSLAISDKLMTIGSFLVRYGLVLVIGWIGAMKFTGYEADAIQPLVANSPLMSWIYSILGVQAFASLFGAFEIGIAIMIAARPISSKISALGSALAALMFLGTLTFLFSTPGWEPSLGGFPALSVVPGQFLLKDVVLLGAAIWSLAEALRN
ncbi:MAG: YkgB family protein [Cyclobacteriaceae bacterium]